MIGIAEYRMVIGQYTGKPSKKKSVQHQYFNSFKKKKSENEKKYKEYLTNIFLLFSGFIIVPVLFISSTIFLINSINSPQECDIVLPLKIIKILLLISGIEWNPGPSAVCEYCGQEFKRLFNLQRHIERWHHTIINVICRFCQQGFDTEEQWSLHMKKEHKPRTRRWRVSNEAFKKNIIELTMIYSENILEKALGDEVEASVTQQLMYYRRLYGTIRFQFNFAALMKREGLEGVIWDTWYFQSSVQNIISGELGLTEKIKNEFANLKHRIFDYDVNHEGSGWTFVTAEAFTIKIVKIASKTMGKHIPFRPRNNKGNVLKGVLAHTINVRNKDDKCVLYNIILSKFSSQVTGDLTNPRNLKRFLKLINDKDVEYPVIEKDFDILEMNNKLLNISINVWKYYSSKHIEPYFISRNKSKGHTDCNMILIHSKQSLDESTVQHLIHVKDLAALFRESSGNSQLRKKLFCPACMLYKSASHDKMLKHYKQCRNPNFFKEYYAPAKGIYLPDGNIIPPPNSYRTSTPVLRGFFDFETLHHPKIKEECNICYTRLQKLSCMNEMEIYCTHKNKKTNIHIFRTSSNMFFFDSCEPK